MFDISGGEFLVIGLVALIVIGPKELPGLLRTVGNSMGKLRRMAGDFRQQFDDAMREAEMADAQKKMEDTADLARSAMTAFNPIETIRNEIRGATQQASAAINAGNTVSTAVAPDMPALPPESAPVAPVVAAADPEPPIEVLKPAPAKVDKGATGKGA